MKIFQCSKSRSSDLEHPTNEQRSILRHFLEKKLCILISEGAFHWHFSDPIFGANAHTQFIRKAMEMHNLKCCEKISKINIKQIFFRKHGFRLFILILSSRRKIYNQQKHRDTWGNHDFSPKSSVQTIILQETPAHASDFSHTQTSSLGVQKLATKHTSHHELKFAPGVM